MSNKNTSREAFEKWMQDKAPKGIDIHSAWEVWLAALAHSAQSQEAQPVYMVCFADISGPSEVGKWREATADTYNTFTEKNRRILYSAPIQPSAQPAGVPESHSAKAGGEQLAWESTTPCYTKFVTDSRYQKFSPKVQKWYKPICQKCAQQATVSAQMTDEEIIKVINDANVMCVHPGADTTLDIARAIERHLLYTAHSQQERVIADELPPLPEALFVCSTVVPEDTPTYTADQMREYARLAISTAHSSETPVPQQTQQDEISLLEALAQRFADVPYEMWQAIEVANLLREYVPDALLSTAHSSDRIAVLEEAACAIEAKKNGASVDLIVQAFADEIRALKSQPSSMPQQSEDKRDDWQYGQPARFMPIEVIVPREYPTGKWTEFSALIYIGDCVKHYDDIYGIGCEWTGFNAKILKWRKHVEPAALSAQEKGGE